MDWSKTALGPLPLWDSAKRNSVFHCLSLQWPAAIVSACFVELPVLNPVQWLLPPGATECSKAVLIFNTAYRTILGKKASWAMGKSFEEIWAEVAEPVSKVCNQVISTGKTVLTRNTTFCVDTLENSILKESE